MLLYAKQLHLHETCYNPMRVIELAALLRRAGESNSGRLARFVVYRTTFHHQMDTLHGRSKLVIGVVLRPALLKV